MQAKAGQDDLLWLALDDFKYGDAFDPLLGNQTTEAFVRAHSIDDRKKRTVGRTRRSSTKLVRRPSRTF
jgi:hypothetical protein